MNLRLFCEYQDMCYTCRKFKMASENSTELLLRTPDTSRDTVVEKNTRNSMTTTEVGILILWRSSEKMNGTSKLYSLFQQTRPMKIKKDEAIVERINENNSNAN